MSRFQIGKDTKERWGVYDEEVWEYVFYGTQEECESWVTTNYPKEKYVLFP